MIGERLGNYRIVRPLGEGGMGVVYLAEHEILRRPAAVKVLHAELNHSQDLVDRFIREAQATAAIRHPGIVEILDCGFHSSGKAYIVMEFLEGQSLRQHLLEHGRLQPAEMVLIARQVADAVGAVHEQGVVHRDLKPDNVFLVGGRLDQVKVLDLGIAKLLGDTATRAGAKATRTGVVLGTPAYMSPEQCRGNGPIDHRADIYSLGCVLYEMATGQPPFSYQSTGELIAAHIHEPPQSPQTLRAQLPSDLGHLILKLLSKSLIDRPGSMRAVGAALDRLQIAPAGLGPGGTAILTDGRAVSPVSAGRPTPVPRTVVLPPTSGSVSASDPALPTPFFPNQPRTAVLSPGEPSALHASVAIPTGSSVPSGGASLRDVSLPGPTAPAPSGGKEPVNALGYTRLQMRQLGMRWGLYLLVVLGLAAYHYCNSPFQVTFGGSGPTRSK